jgi:ribonuclease J
MVGLCNQFSCELCNLPEREKLRDFRGGRLEVRLTLHRRPSFWEVKEFYLGHLITIPEREGREIDESIEFDVSKSNAFLYTTDSGTLLIDPGSISFNGDEALVKQLITNQRVVATVISHAHLDHINQLGEIRGPVVMTKIAFRLTSRHADLERDARMVRALRGAKMVVPGEPVVLERSLPFRVDTFSLPHSIPETIGFVIKGNRKRVVHLADFKLSGWEGDSKAKTIATLREIAKEPVDILALTITNAHIGGFTPIEVQVIDSLTNIIAEAKGRVIITCFSSNLERIRRIVEVAQLLERPVIFYGAGMQNAQELLEIKTEEGAIESEKAVVFVSGCQAEENSVLWRIVEGENPAFELRSDDTLVFSSRCIPGNEEKLRRMIADLRSRLRIIVNEGEIKQVGLEGVEEALTHISGHECGGGLSLVIEILRPKQILAWPQTEPQIGAFRKIAQEAGVEILPETERIIAI